LLPSALGGFQSSDRQFTKNPRIIALRIKAGYTFSSKGKFSEEIILPARIVLVHDDAEFVAQAVTALRAEGWDTKGYATSAGAILALDEALLIELLITKIEFDAGTPHGISLALMARTKRPAIRVLFTADPELKKHTEGIGELLPPSISVPELVQKVGLLFGNDTTMSPASSS
jgi:hypothetical protein